MFAVYSPEPNFLVPELKKLPMFHDPSFALSPDHTEHPLVMPYVYSSNHEIHKIEIRKNNNF